MKNNANKRVIYLSLIASLLLGCSTLDEQSSFENIIANTSASFSSKQIKTRTYTPQVAAIKGVAPTKVRLHITADQQQHAELTLATATIHLDISYLKNQDDYLWAELHGVRVDLKNRIPNLESCSEFCITTQYLTLLINGEQLDQAAQTGMSIILHSRSGSVVTQFEVAAGYFDALQAELIDSQPRERYKKEQLADSNYTPKTIDMITYWYQRATEQQRLDFTDWAYTHRNSQPTVQDAPEIAAQTLSMLKYWYSQADQQQKKQILAWLIAQN